MLPKSRPAATHRSRPSTPRGFAHDTHECNDSSRRSPLRASPSRPRRSSSLSAEITQRRTLNRRPAPWYRTNAKAPGVEFQYTADGHTYRATVLDRDTPHTPGPNLTPMITIALIRRVEPSGITVLWSGRSTPYLVILYATDLAKVRVNPTRTVSTGLDEMTPVNGWVAFAAPDSSPALPFDRSVEGLDTAGHVVTTAYPWRCC
jgi:hypothetical protein